MGVYKGGVQGKLDNFQNSSNMNFKAILKGRETHKERHTLVMLET